MQKFYWKMQITNDITGIIKILYIILINKSDRPHLPADIRTPSHFWFQSCKCAIFFVCLNEAYNAYFDLRAAKHVHLFRALRWDNE